jgi:hypothetical protein
MTLSTIGESFKVRKKWLIFFVVGSPGCIIAFYFKLWIDFIVKADSLNLKQVAPLD